MQDLKDMSKGIWPTWEEGPTPLELCRKFLGNKRLKREGFFQKRNKTPCHKLLYELVLKVITPRQEKRSEACALDICLMEFLDTDQDINFPSFIIQLLGRLIYGTGNHALPYGFFIMEILRWFKVPFSHPELTADINFLGRKFVELKGYSQGPCPSRIKQLS